ncbi:MAG: hypothetical protein GXZ08_10310 [Tissierellia bacterium]|nr:hypothetical protein [Tissierellia bacterium]
MKDIINMLFEMMQSKVTLYINISLLILGLILLVSGSIMYIKKSKDVKGKTPKKYLALPIVGAILTVGELVQIGIYLMVVTI